MPKRHRDAKSLGSPDWRVQQGMHRLYAHTQLFFKRFYLFRESEREGDREEEKHQCVVVSQVSPTGDLAHNPGLCPGWEWN